ncbi:hypothetical protein N7451_001250 [Penicillium sp. IBT 35674x]|nr:hypothetical protein N7451_001250 [Penicillium sp. IBT 35674x]
MGDLGQPDTSLEMNAETTSCLDSVVFPAENWDVMYNPKDLSSDVDQAITSTTNVQQPQNQHMRPQKQGVPLQTLDHFDDLMTDDSPAHRPATSGLFWPIGSTSTQIAGSRPSPTHGNLSNTSPSSRPGPAVMPYDLYHSIQTQMSDRNGLDMSGKTSSSVAGLQLAFDAIDSVPDGMENNHQLFSLLTHRAGRLGNCSPGGSVSIQAEGCDREVLNYVLDVLLPIRHLVKMEINM